MTPQLIQLKSLPNVALVRMPEGVPIPDVINTGQPHLSWLDIDIDLPDINLPPGNWRIIEMLSEVREDQAAGLVDYDEDERYYKAYGKHSQVHKNGIVSQLVGYLDALESLESAILAEGWKFHNPYKKPDYIPKTMTAEFAYREEMDDWEKAESRVLCRERCLLLIKR